MREQSSEPSVPPAPSVPYAIAFLIGASLLAIAAAGFHIYLIRVREFPDMSSYAEAAEAVRHWRLPGVAARQFWGYSYAAVLLSFLLPGVPMLVFGLVLIAALIAALPALAQSDWRRIGG